MIPVEATVKFQGPTSEFNGKVIVGPEWVYIVSKGELYPRERIAKIELDYPFKELKEKIEFLMNQN